MKRSRRGGSRSRSPSPSRSSASPSLSRGEQQQQTRGLAAELAAAREELARERAEREALAARCAFLQAKLRDVAERSKTRAAALVRLLAAGGGVASARSRLAEAEAALSAATDEASATLQQEERGGGAAPTIAPTIAPPAPEALSGGDGWVAVGGQRQAGAHAGGGSRGV